MSRSKKKSRPTLKDVAELSNVSPMTVSNVIHKRFKFVGDDTRRRVEKAIRELNYVPNATSRKLRSQREFTIGMIIMDGENDFLINPFVGQLVAGLSNCLNQNNHSLTIQGVKPSELEKASLFTHTGTDGLCAIFCGNATERREYFKFMLRLDQPIVAFQDSILPRNSNISTVSQNDRDGANLLARHVLRDKARILLAIEPSMEWPAIMERRSGIIAAVRQVEGARLKTLYCDESKIDEVQELIHDYLKSNDPPDAIMGATDSIGVSALRFCQDHGYHVPNDIMVTGFNGFELVRYTNPPLTTVQSRAYDMGFYAGSLLLNRIESGRFEKRKTVFPVSLIVGGST